MYGETVRLVENARSVLRSHGYFVDNLWHVDDIHFISEQQQLPSLTHQEAMQIFAIANEEFDGEVGLSWPQLENALRLYLKRRVLLAEMLQLHTAPSAAANEP